MIKALKAELGLSGASVIELAVRKLARAELRHLKQPGKPAGKDTFDPRDVSILGGDPSE